MIIEGIREGMVPVRIELNRLVVKDRMGNIIGFFQEEPSGAILLTVIEDKQFEQTLEEFGLRSSVIIDYLENK